MPKLPLTTQAALIFEMPPALDLARLLEDVNAALDEAELPTFEMGPAGTDVFALYRSDTLHATVAVHSGPLGLRGLERALTAPAAEAQIGRFEQALTKGRAHVVIAVGEGPSPVRFDTPAPVAAEIRLKVLARILDCVTAHARPMAAHVCSSDMLYTPEALAAALTGTPETALLLHPEVLTEQTGPQGEEGRGLILWNSHHLIGRTLVIEGLPAPVPARVAAKLAQTLIRQSRSGKIRLDPGASLKDAAGTMLRIRHEAPDEADPAGRIVASFWAAPASAGGAETAAPFVPHPGYTAFPADPAPAPENAEAQGWTAPGAIPHSRSERRGGASPNWMLWVGFGLFLWIGLPLLNVPKMVIEAAFSSADENPFLARKP